MSFKKKFRPVLVPLAALGAVAAGGLAYATSPAPGSQNAAVSERGQSYDNPIDVGIAQERRLSACMTVRGESYAVHVPEDAIAEQARESNTSQETVRHALTLPSGDDNDPTTRAHHLPEAARHRFFEAFTECTRVENTRVASAAERDHSLIIQGKKYSLSDVPALIESYPEVKAARDSMPACFDRAGLPARDDQEAMSRYYDVGAGTGRGKHDPSRVLDVVQECSRGYADAYEATYLKVYALNESVG